MSSDHRDHRDPGPVHGVDALSAMMVHHACTEPCWQQLRALDAIAVEYDGVNPSPTHVVSAEDEQLAELLSKWLDHARRAGAHGRG